jgi:Zn finger protein HypA/HybF involved in hydrogenase expression
VASQNSILECVRCSCKFTFSAKKRYDKCPVCNGVDFKIVESSKYVFDPF